MTNNDYTCFTRQSCYYRGYYIAIGIGMIDVWDILNMSESRWKRYLQKNYQTFIVGNFPDKNGPIYFETQEEAERCINDFVMPKLVMLQLTSS